jgi:hypothetical protein
MPKPNCKKKKDSKVENPEFRCINCKALADKRKYLCKPKKIK